MSVDSLAELCEIVIAKSFKDIDQLPLPASIKTKILFHCYEKIPDEF
jgi:hypothetical protein